MPIGLLLDSAHPLAGIASFAAREKNARRREDCRVSHHDFLPGPGVHPDYRPKRALLSDQPGR
jgi:hypothetical protein